MHHPIPAPARTTTARTRSATEYTTVGNRLMPRRRDLPKRLLGVWAHPDDEAYLSAGLMARVVEAGGSVTVLTATRGEKGTDDPDRYDRDEFGELREGELRASLRTLGVDDVRFMDLRDGECDLADDATAIDRISMAIEDVVPDAVVTFGPDGMTNHADHRAVSRWTTEAWRRAGRGDLLYAAVTHDWIALHRETHDRLGVYADFADGRPPSIGRARVALECSLTEAEVDRKRAALAAHDSQTTGLAALMGEDTYRSWFRDERFRRPTPGEVGRCETPDWMRPVRRVERELAGASS